MWVCGFCDFVSTPHQPLTKHTRYKPGTSQIDVEIPACGECLKDLGNGVKPPRTRKEQAQKEKAKEMVREETLKDLIKKKFIQKGVKPKPIKLKK